MPLLAHHTVLLQTHMEMLESELRQVRIMWERQIQMQEMIAAQLQQQQQQQQQQLSHQAQHSPQPLVSQPPQLQRRQLKKDEEKDKEGNKTAAVDQLNESHPHSR